MKTARTYIVLMVFQVCIIHGVLAKVCIVAGLSKNGATEVILKNHYRSDTARTNSLGVFQFKISLDSPQYFEVRANRIIQVFLVPGDSIFINLDRKTTVGPDNQSAMISNYLIGWYATTDSIGAHFDRVAFYSQDPASFSAAMTKQYDTLRTLFDEFLARSPGVNKEFVRLEKARIQFWVWPPYNRYEYRYQLFTGKKVQPPEEFYDYLRNVDFNDASYLQLPDFVNFIDTFLEMKVFKATQQDQQSYGDPYFKTKVLLQAIRKTFTNQRVLDEILYRQMWGQIYYMDVNDSLFSLIENTLREPKHVAGLRKLYKSLRKFQAGHSAPDFKLLDAKDNPYTLKDFKGKYLLIDVWGVYCGPCIKELPTLKEIETEFHDANITFIAVNLDGTKDAWIKRVKDLNLDGLQCMPTNGWGSEFREAYGVEQVPTFILIDPKGKFVDARAKLPTEGLRYVLNTLPAIRNK